MVKPSLRNQKKKFVKVTKSTKEIRFRDGSKGASCSICSKRLQGVPKKGVAKLAKTEKRPSILFGGILCNTCRDSVFDDAIMLKTGLIEEKDVSFKKMHFVKESLLKIHI